MKIAKKRKNPADVTGRNNNARKKEIAEIKKKLNEVIVSLNMLLEDFYSDVLIEPASRNIKRL